MITFPKVRFDGVLKNEGILENPYFVPNQTITKTGEELETPGKGMILAANGSVLAAIPVRHDPTDTEGSIPNAVLLAAGKRAPKKDIRLDATFENSVARMVGEELVIDERTEGHFPNVICLVKGIQWEETIVTLDVDLLVKLADALCERSRHNRKADRYLRLTVHTTNRPVLVEPLDCKDDRWGIIMPMQQRS